MHNFYEIGVVNVIQVSKRPKIDENLFEVEIVVANNPERKQITINFVDYREQFDEWRDLMTVKSITFPSFVWKRCFFPKETGSAFFTVSFIIKLKFWSTGRRDYPEV